MRRFLAIWLACCLSLCAMVTFSTASLAQEYEEMLRQSAESFLYAKVATQKGTLNMRAEPSDNAKVLEKLPRGSIIQVIENMEEWTHVLYKNRSGYVKNSFLEALNDLPYTPITKESDGSAIIGFKRTIYKLGYLKSEEINQRFDKPMEKALTKLQLMNDVPLTPGLVTPELQALIEWGKVVKCKSGFLDTQVDPDTGLTVSIFCWDSGEILFEEDSSVKINVTFCAKAAGGQPPYSITVVKSLGKISGGDEVTSPFSFIWSESFGDLYLYATVMDASGNTVTACTPFRYTMPARWNED